MSDVAMEWRSPGQRRQRTVVGWLLLAVVSLIAATALVHGFDVVARQASLAALIGQAGPLYPVACAACDPGFVLPLPDWRAFGVWALALASAAAMLGLTRRHR